MLVVAMVSDKGDVMPLHIFTLGLKINTEEHLKARKEAVKSPMVGWMLLDVPRPSRRISACPQGHGDQGLMPDEPPGALVQGGQGLQQPQLEAPVLLCL